MVEILETKMIICKHEDETEGLKFTVIFETVEEKQVIYSCAVQYDTADLELAMKYLLFGD